MLRFLSDLIFLKLGFYNCWKFLGCNSKIIRGFVSVKKCRIIIYGYRGFYVYLLCYNYIIKFGVIKRKR